MSLSVSVVIPCYNAEAFVAEAVASAVGQTHPPEAVVCVDDGSTDGTLALLRRLEAEHPRVRVLTGSNGGPSAARNRGLAVASGTYVQFLDADDLLDRTKLAHQLALAEAADVPPDLIAASYRAVWADGREVIREVGEDPWTSLVAARLGTPSANLWRREAVVEVGGWREGMHTSEDPELMFRLLQAGASVLRDEVVRTTLRRRPGSLWNADYERSQRGWFALRRAIVDYMDASGLLTVDRRRRVARKLFTNLDALYQKDPALAVEMHEVIRGAPVGPASAGFGAPYVWTYRLGGFRLAQTVRAGWRRAYWSAARRSDPGASPPSSAEVTA